MKNILLVGAGEKFGLELTKIYLQNNWSVWSMGSVIPDGCKPLNINWNTFTPDDVESIANKLPSLDAVFFNQNSIGPPMSTHFTGTEFGHDELFSWSKSHWINNQMPVYLLRKLGDKINNKTTVGWQLGWGNFNLPKDDHGWSLAGYASAKMTNLIVMRGFANTKLAIFYAIDPGGISPGDRSAVASKIFKLQTSLTPSDNGRVMDIEKRDV